MKQTIKYLDVSRQTYEEFEWRREDKDKDLDLRKILRSRYQDYPLPVKKNVDFMRGLETTFKNSSFIAEEHPSDIP